MRKSGGRKLLLFSFLLLLLVTMGFSGGLNIYSFQQTYTDSVVENYALAGREAVREIEYALKYGKDIDNFYGIKEDILQAVSERMAGQGGVLIVKPDGAACYSLNTANQTRENAASLIPKAEQELTTAAQGYVSLQQDHHFYVFMPVNNDLGSIEAYFTLIFDQSLIGAKMESYFRRLLLCLIGLTVLAGLLFTGLLRKGKLVDGEGRIRQKVLLRNVLILLGVIQIVYGYLNYQIFQQGYLSVAQEKAAVLSGVLQQNIGGVTAKGVPYQDLYGLAEYLQTIDASLPEIDGITLTDEKGTVLYTTSGLTGSSGLETGSAYTLELPADQRGNGAMIGVHLSAGYLAEKTKHILLDMLSILAVSIFFLVEITLFGFVFLERKFQRPENLAKSRDVNKIRPLSFMVYGACNMAIAFIPLAMKNLYLANWGWPVGVVVGLPITAEMLCALLATIYAGGKVDKIGWKPVFMIGIAVLSLGNILSGVVGAAWLFMAARGIAGAGFGAMLMGLRAYVIAFSSAEARAQGIAGMNAGALAGISCGAVTGAMVADRLGFAPVFMISGVMVLLAMLFALRYFPNIRLGREEKEEESLSVADPQQTLRRLANFVSNRQVLTYLFFVLLPLSVVSMYLAYFVPLYTDQTGLSVGDAGRIILVNGICIIYAGPFLSRYLLTKIGNKRATVLFLLVTAAALLTFAYLHNLKGMLASVILLGLAESFGAAANTNYYLDLKPTAAYGAGKAMGIYSVVNKLGQTMGPIVFALVSWIGMAGGAGLVGVGVILFMLLFVLLTRNKLVAKLKQGRPLNG